MSVGRRGFVVAGAVLTLLPALAIRSSPQSPGGSEADSDSPGGSEAAREPVVSFHLDQPYLDLTGLEKPYVPPAGMRSGAPLAALGEEEVFSRLYGFI
jgi:hypothetical protein